MNLVSHTAEQLLIMFWYLIPVMVLACVLRTPWFKGIMGEFIVNLSVKFLLDKNTYHLIKNVTLPTEDGTTQIDHIIVSIYGIFVVETKNMKGWIFGGQNQKTWTQKIFRSSCRFQNPLHQNIKHTKTIASLLDIPEQNIHSVIVFIGDSTFKTEMPDNVTYGGGYARYIKSKTKPVLSKSEVSEIIDRIETGRLKPSFKTDREHARHVRQIISKKDNATQPLCPKCGGDMVLRKSRKESQHGNQFWGCTRFPQCRGIVDIDRT